MAMWGQNKHPSKVCSKFKFYKIYVNHTFTRTLNESQVLQQCRLCGMTVLWYTLILKYGDGIIIT